jgi:FtsH-binding integral membrane protein
MDYTVTVLNWMALTLLVPATLILVWKMVSDKLKGNRLSSDLITVSLVLSFVVIGVTQLNIERGVSWLRWVLLVAQLLLLVVLYKRVWPPFIQKLHR